MAVGTPSELLNDSWTNSEGTQVANALTAASQPIFFAYAGLNAAPTFSMDSGIGAPDTFINQESEFGGIWVAIGMWNTPGTGSRVITVSGPSFADGAIVALDASGISTPADGAQSDFLEGAETSLDLTISSETDGLVFGAIAAQAAITPDGTSLHNAQVNTASLYLSVQTEPGAASTAFGGNVAAATSSAIAAFSINPAAGGLSVPVAMHHYTKNLG